MVLSSNKLLASSKDGFPFVDHFDDEQDGFINPTLSIGLI